MSFNRAPKGHLCTMWELKQKTEYHLVPLHLGTGDSNFSVLSISMNNCESAVRTDFGVTKTVLTSGQICKYGIC